MWFRVLGPAFKIQQSPILTLKLNLSLKVMSILLVSKLQASVETVHAHMLSNLHQQTGEATGSFLNPYFPP